MPAISRVGDIGIGVCPCHNSPVSYVTNIVTGASTVNADKTNVAVVGSIGISSCGHPTTALTGSPSVNAEKTPVHRVGDSGQNCGSYTMMVGSSDANANNRK